MSEPKFVHTDVRKKFDEPLLRRFYEELMVPNFGIFADELEGVDVWIAKLRSPAAGQDFQLHVLVAFEVADKEQKDIVGGVACEYYPESNCGLMTYIAVSQKHQRKGVAQYLVANALAAIADEAKDAGKPSLNAFFLETNNENVDSSVDVMDPRVRHKVLHSLGFRILNFRYVQPSLEEGKEKCMDLLFACHHSFLTDMGEDLRGLRGDYIKAFVKEFFTVLMGEESTRTDVDYLASAKELDSKLMVSARA